MLVLVFNLLSIPASAALFYILLYMLLAWIRTVVDFRSYHLLAKASAGRLVLFSLWLFFINILIFNTYFIFQLHSHLPTVLKSLPDLTFAEGKLLSPQQPVSVVLSPTDYRLVFDSQAKNPPDMQDFSNQQIAVFFASDKIYIPSVRGLQAQPIPPAWNVALNQENWPKYAGNISAVLQMFAFLGSILATLLFIAVSLVLSRVILSLWKAIRHCPVPNSTLWKWAVLLQGPALLLWTIHLFVTVPLFLFALFILFMMYSQQIYNTLPEK